MATFDPLFSPLTLGKTRLPNRICFLAHRTNYTEAGRLTDRHIAYCSRRARGGSGLIILGEVSIHPNDRPWETLIEGFRPDVVKDYRKFTEATHHFETPAFLNLCHHGFQSSGEISRETVWGPSAIADIAFRETAKSMEKEDMDEILAAFAKAAIFAREGGFDGVEIDIGAESLLRQFLSPISNHRQDEYGGSLENRIRFPMEVLAGVRGAVGEDFTVGLRLCIDEKFWGGISIDESKKIAAKFENSMHCDFINISVGTYYNLHLVYPSMNIPFEFTAELIELADQIKKEIKIPLITNSETRFPQMARDILVKGEADVIGLVRTLICDPDAPNKTREGRVKDIRLCVKDNQGCIGRINQGKTIGCIQNPDLGFEKMSGGEGKKPLSKKKLVIIIGGGPGGMEAARAAAACGHEVTLYERQDELGGQINIAKLGAGRAEIGQIAANLRVDLERLKVRIECGVEVTDTFVLERNPSTVVVATGSIPKGKPFAGQYSPSEVLNVWQVLKGERPVGQRVCLIDGDGHHKATGTAEFLADQGKEVHILTDALFVGVELGSIGDLYASRQRLLQKGVTFMPDMSVQEIEGTKVKAVNLFSNELQVFEGFDTVVAVVAQRPNDSLYFNLKGKIKELYRIGDCVAPRRIDMAIHEGNKVGSAL